MIGRNEAEHLRCALMSVRSFTDEIVFVDTGSVDSTSDIAQAFGAKVLRFSWTDDFAAARNHALEHCSSDWILSIDCDEELVSVDTTAALFSNLKSNKSDVAFVLDIENRLPGGGVDTHQDVRIFRNSPLIRYCNPIHESVSPSVHRLTPKKCISRLPLSIKHNGYCTPENNKLKLIRNQKILCQWVSSEPDNPYAWYKLGLTLRALASEHASACLFRSFELVVADKDPGSFAFRHELLESLLRSLDERSQALVSVIRAEWARTFPLS